MGDKQYNGNRGWMGVMCTYPLLEIGFLFTKLNYDTHIRVCSRGDLCLADSSHCSGLFVAAVSWSWDDMNRKLMSVVIGVGEFFPRLITDIMGEVFHLFLKQGIQRMEDYSHPFVGSKLLNYYNQQFNAEIKFSPVDPLRQ